MRYFAVAVAILLSATCLRAQGRSDSLVLRFADADVKSVIRELSPYLRKPVVAGEMPALRITLDAPNRVAASEVEALLRGALEARGFLLRDDSTHLSIVPQGVTSTAGVAAAQVTGATSLHVVQLKHARAADVAATINALYGGPLAIEGRRGLSGGTLGDELRRLASSTTQSPGTSGSMPATLSAPVVLVPDERTNSLLLRATESDAGVLRAAVSQLDLRPLQVLLEVLIVEASRDRALDLSIGGQYGRGGARDSTSVRLPSADPGGLVLQVMRLSRADLTLRLGAAEANGMATIVSRPVVVVSNNAEARFLVGSQRPFVQISRSLPTDVPIRDQVIQYRDVGTRLVVRPSINQDGYVALLVQQEMSSATEETQFGAPVISTREASTEVLVKDGQTIVLGGLTDSLRSRSRSGVPLLARVPLLGALFGQSRRRTAATEFFLFLTPHVIRSDDDVDRLTRERRGTPSNPQH